MSAGTQPFRLGRGVVDGEARLLVEHRGVIVDLAGAVDWLGHASSMVEAIASWVRLRRQLPAAWARVARHAVSAEAVAWLPPVEPRKLLCAGANYRGHLDEMRAGVATAAETPPFPYFFFKPVTAVVGDCAVVPLPSYAELLDWEAELAVVMAGPPGQGDPLDAVFGYTLLDDLSVRDFVRPFAHSLGLDALACKGFDGAAPLGRWITPAEFVPDPQRLRVKLAVNGVVKQDGSTADMVFDVRACVAHCSAVLTLEAGDVIATGTPAGVGIARRPPQRLAPGDEVRIEIEGLGALTTRIGLRAEGPRTLDRRR